MLVRATRKHRKHGFMRVIAASKLLLVWQELSPGLKMLDELIYVISSLLDEMPFRRHAHVEGQKRVIQGDFYVLCRIDSKNQS